MIYAKSAAFKAMATYSKPGTRLDNPKAKNLALRPRPRIKVPGYKTFLEFVIYRISGYTLNSFRKLKSPFANLTVF